MSVDIATQLSQFSTSCLSDALDRLGIAGQAFGIHPLRPEARLAGPAFTVTYAPVGSDGGTVGDYIDDVPPGSVLVLDNRGRLDATVWGDILTSVAAHRGIAGTVIDGVCRDSRRSRELDYPIFSRGTWMRTGKDRVRMVAVQVAATLGDVLVQPGDSVVGDGDGAVVVPASRADEVLEVATRIEAAEDQIRTLVESGVPLLDARTKLGYHNLQSR